VKVIAPGKLLLTGAYAVLDGAPAIVVAVDRYAVADASRTTNAPTAEVRAALGEEPAPEVDVRELQDASGRKLGLGSSAAALVASLGARAWAARKEDLTAPLLRARIFRTARAAHARAQGGGSGVDVAASVHGGALRYALDAEGVSVRALEPPADLVLAAYWSGASARTSDLLARVGALRARDPRATPFGELRSLADGAADAFEQADARAFVAAARDYGRALGALGHAADAPIVPPSFEALAAIAAAEGAAFLPSGAGGGDVAIWLGTSLPSPDFAARADTCSMRPLALSIDRGGVRLHAPS
jgi:phosphomevalonate kinase